MEKKYFFDNRRNVRLLLTGFYIILACLIVADFFIPKHPYFSWETYPSFSGTFGFVSCVGLVLAAKHLLRKFVMRKEDYYE